MLMSDVIKVLGDTPLKSFPWGCTVRDTVNLFVESDHRITEESTGAGVKAALNTLSPDTKALVLQAKLDTARNCMATSAGGGLVMEHGDPVNALEDTNALYRMLLTPQFIGLTSAVVMPVLLAGFLISRLDIHKNIPWKEVFTTMFSTFGFSI